MIGPRRWRALSWRTQLWWRLTVLFVGVLALAGSTGAFVIQSNVEKQTEGEALGIARALSSDARIAGWLTAGPPLVNGPIQRTAELTRTSTQALYVVVTDATGVRYSHPNPAEIGRPAVLDLSLPLRGEEQMLISHGTLGWAASGLVPLRDGSNKIVGVVAVGMPISEVYEIQRRLAIALLPIGALALLIGLIGLAGLQSRVRRDTLGLEPGEMADLLREHAALLADPSAGIIALDAAGRVRIGSDVANRLLGARVEPGRPVEDSGLPPGMVSILLDPVMGASAEDGSRLRLAHGRLVVAGGRVLDVRVFPVEHQNHDLGVVIVVRDRTDLDDLGRELEATRALTDALRAQNHEHANQLHVLSGLVARGDLTQTRQYLDDLAAPASDVVSLDDPYLSGMLSAKSAVAAEQGVELRISEESWISGRLNRPLDTVTVVGNLVDNAIRAAAGGSRRPAWVEVSLLSDGADLVAHVVDSGDGVAAGSEEAIFGESWTTKTDPTGVHGVGLALARVTARHHGGDVTLSVARGEDHGAAFSAVLTNVLLPPGDPR